LAQTEKGDFSRLQTLDPILGMHIVEEIEAAKQSSDRKRLLDDVSMLADGIINNYLSVPLSVRQEMADIYHLYIISQELFRGKPPSWPICGAD